VSTEQVSTSHIGYLCRAPKIAVIRNPTSKTFTVQNMALIDDAPLSAAAASFKVIFTGKVEYRQTLLGTFGICDFSSVTAPGVYRVVLPESQALSYQFNIADGAYHKLPYLFLDFIHELRSGYFESDLRRPTHVDDGVRSDTGEQWDAAGGWYDAGDVRKWSTHSTLAALAFMDAQQYLRLNRRMFEQPDAFPTDWLTETAWGLRYIYKVQDPETGMIFEDVGGGSTARRREGMSWWYENHAGCYADNADNRFTDNITNSGDERSIRVQYNPLSQYTNITILARSYILYAQHSAELSQRSYEAALAAWNFCKTRLNDDEHTWTTVRSWRLCAALELYQAGLVTLGEVEDAVTGVMENFNVELGFWTNTCDTMEPYRAILHSAQPLIALAKYLEYLPEGEQVPPVKEALGICKQRYIDPMVATNPYRFMPFGAYSEKLTPDDLYRPWREKWFARFCMPTHHPQQINHGLSGHWMSWAHGLAYVGQVLSNSSWTALAWAQIEWLTGNNAFDVSFISGIGYNNPMPHSRLLGTIIGGFMNGFRGTEADIPHVDLLRECEWNSTEYWNTPLSNCLMALSRLLPTHIRSMNKLG
jgi:hypothetical protein